MVFTFKVDALDCRPYQHLLRTYGIKAAFTALLDLGVFTGLAFVAYRTALTDFAVLTMAAHATPLLGILTRFLVLPGKPAPRASYVHRWGWLLLLEYLLW